jgi:signal transduction histidine kinase
VIRNVVVGRLRPAGDTAQQAADAALLQEGLAGIAALRCPGMLAMSVGTDLGLRDSGWDFAVTNDWQDADAYRVYDQDEEHNRLRREIFAQICQDIARVQFQVDPLTAALRPFAPLDHSARIQTSSLTHAVSEIARDGRGS